MIYSRPISIQAILCIVRIAHKLHAGSGSMPARVSGKVSCAICGMVLTMTVGDNVVQVARLCAANSDVHETILGVLADWDDS